MKGGGVSRSVAGHDRNARPDMKSSRRITRFGHVVGGSHPIVTWLYAASHVSASGRIQRNQFAMDNGLKAGLVSRIATRNRQKGIVLFYIVVRGSEGQSRIGIYR